MPAADEAAAHPSAGSVRANRQSDVLPVQGLLQRNDRADLKVPAAIWERVDRARHSRGGFKPQCVREWLPLQPESLRL